MPVYRAHDKVQVLPALWPSLLIHWNCSPMRKSFKIGPIYISIDSSGVHWGLGNPPRGRGRRNRRNRGRRNRRNNSRWVRKLWRMFQNKQNSKDSNPLSSLQDQPPEHKAPEENNDAPLSDQPPERSSTS